MHTLHLGPRRARITNNAKKYIYQGRRPYVFKVFIEYPLNLGSGCISVSTFSVNLTSESSWVLNTYTFTAQKVAKSSKLKIASLMSCQRSDLRKTLKYSQHWTPCLIFEYPTAKVRRRSWLTVVCRRAMPFQVHKKLVAGAKSLYTAHWTQDDVTRTHWRQWISTNTARMMSNNVNKKHWRATLLCRKHSWSANLCLCTRMSVVIPSDFFRSDR